MVAGIPAPASHAGQARCRLLPDDRRDHVRFIQEIGYTVKVGQEEAFQQWLVENEETFANAHPEGTRYLGTFLSVYSTDKQAGGYRMFVELDSYGALDRLAAASKDSASEFGRLNREGSRFGDWDVNAPWSNALHKAVVDATVWDPIVD
jgi:hypothetical protein